VRNLLKDQLNDERQKDLSFDDIQRMVADYFDLRLTDMSSKRRPRSVAAPRQVAMFLCRKLTRSSLPEIANSFGKTHATVMHACKTVQNRSSEEELRDSVRENTRKWGESPSLSYLIPLKHVNIMTNTVHPFTIVSNFHHAGFSHRFAVLAALYQQVTGDVVIPLTLQMRMYDLVLRFTPYYYF
jgi:hypothetical protein